LAVALSLVLAACGPEQPRAQSEAPTGAYQSQPTPGASQSRSTPGASQTTGVVLGVDSPALGQVDGFELLTEEGTVLAFDTSELAFDPDFPASHVTEHQVLGDPVKVTYRADGDRLVVTRLEDAE
jgi:hypothetical protein